MKRITLVLTLAALVSLSGDPVSHSQGTVASLAAPELILQAGHAFKINAVTFGLNDTILVSGGADHKIIVWDVASGRELRMFSGHTGYINALAISNDGKLLASGSNDRSIKLWNLSTGVALKTLTGHSQSVGAVAFGPNNWIASGSTDGVIKIWDATTGRPLQTYSAHQMAITNLRFSPDGKLLASAASDGSIKLWRASDWGEERTGKNLAKRVTSISFNADGSVLASASEEGRILLWDVATNKEKPLTKILSGKILTLKLKADNTLIAGYADGSLKVWDTITGREQSSVAKPPDVEDFVSLALSSDGNLAAWGSGDMRIDLRNTASNNLDKVLKGQTTGLNAVAFSNDGRWLAAGANDGTVRVWQIATGTELRRLAGHTAYVTTIAFSNDNRLLASGSRSGEVKIWDVSDGKQVFSSTNAGGGINAVAFSPDAKSLASAGMEPALVLWDLESKREQTLIGPGTELTSVSFSSDGQLLAAGGRDKTVNIRDAKNGGPIKTIGPLPAEINSLAFSPDNRSLALGNANSSIDIVDVASSSSARHLDHGGREILKVAFRPDGRVLASSGYDHNIKLWDMTSGNLLHTLPGPAAATNGLSFSADSRWLLSGSEDGRMIIWNASTGTQMATLVEGIQDETWLVSTPEGLFDGSPTAWDLLLWRFAGDTFSVLPVEAFFNEYFYPGLLADILAGKDPHPAEAIATKDRRQPSVVVAYDGKEVPAINSRKVKLRLEITDAAPDKDHTSGSGATDLRLFRNGLLIQKWSGDVLAGGTKKTIEPTVNLVAGENRFTAYVFNKSGVKSSNARLALRGDNALKRPGTAYVLTIGVGRYANPDYNLNYTVADATEVGGQIKEHQEALAQYNPVVVVQLSNEEATKANILLALKRLTGVDTSPLPATAPAALSKLKVAQPEDALFIYYSGHGDAERDRFYLIPHDLGYSKPRKELNEAALQAIYASSISDLELEEALRSLDVDQLLLMIDACKSGQALDAEDERRGPMNTKGLAQLAYEKGMYVLTASQSNEVAFESEALKHSYLAYALVNEGIRQGQADLDRDGNILVREWFAFAIDRVPRMRREKLKLAKELIEAEKDEAKVQRPRVFYSREASANKLVIATVSRSQ